MLRFCRLPLVVGACYMLLTPVDSVTISAQEPCDMTEIPTNSPDIANNNEVIRWQTWLQPPLSSEVDRYTVTRAVTNLDTRNREVHWSTGQMVVRQLSPGSTAKRCVNIFGHPVRESGPLYFGPLHEDRVEATTWVGLGRVVLSSGRTGVSYGAGGPLQPELTGSQYATRFTLLSADAPAPTVDLMFESSYRVVDGGMYALSYSLLNNASPVQIDATWFPPPMRAQLTARGQLGVEVGPTELLTSNPPILTFGTIDVTYVEFGNLESGLVRAHFDVNVFLPLN